MLDDLDGRIDIILDAGSSRHGLESTIVACLGAEPILLRSGAIPKETIESALGSRLAIPGPPGGAPRSPGQLQSHYAPRATLRLNTYEVALHEAALDFAGALSNQPAIARIDLSPAGNLTEAAARLFASIRELDASGALVIAVAPIPDQGLGAAINDRLSRAAAPTYG